MSNEHLAAGRETGRQALSQLSTEGARSFGARFWGRAPLLSRAADLAHSNLFDAAAVDELVSRRGLRTPFLRMAKDGDVIPAARYTRGGGAGAGVTDQVADDKVLGLIADGATLVLQALHRTWPPLVEFGSQLAAELGHPVQINAYVTPPQNQGFASHYDVHDVFVLQVAGRKQWRIHEPVFDAPLRSDNWEQRRADVADRAAGEPLIDVMLEPGDALYLPRGYLHSAAALGETSIHLTIGIHPVTRHALVEQLLSAAAQDPALRESLPMGVDLQDPAVLAPILAQTVEALHHRLDAARAEDVAPAIAAQLVAGTRPQPLAPLAVLDAIAALTADTPVQLRPGLRVRVEHNGEVQLRLIDKTVTLPGVAESAVKAILSGDPLTPAQLPGLEPAEQLVVTRRLLREGVLVPAP